jgi:hypothetical protein
MLDGTFKWEEEDGLVYFHGKLYIPPDAALCQDIVKSCHNAPTAGLLQTSSSHVPFQILSCIEFVLDSV